MYTDKFPYYLYAHACRCCLSSHQLEQEFSAVHVCKLTKHLLLPIKVILKVSIPKACLIITGDIVDGLSDKHIIILAYNRAPPAYKVLLQHLTMLLRYKTAFFRNRKPLLVVSPDSPTLWNQLLIISATSFYNNISHLSAPRFTVFFFIQWICLGSWKFFEGLCLQKWT